MPTGRPRGQERDKMRLSRLWSLLVLLLAAAACMPSAAPAITPAPDRPTLAFFYTDN